MLYRVRVNVAQIIRNACDGGTVVGTTGLEALGLIGLFTKD